jgi:hypothetical protein
METSTHSKRLSFIADHPVFNWVALLIFLASAHCSLVPLGLVFGPRHAMSTHDQAMLFLTAGLGPVLMVLAFILWGARFSLKLLVGTVLASALLMVVVFFSTSAT